MRERSVLYIIGAGASRFVYNWCGGADLGVCFLVSEGPPTIQMTPHSLESHLKTVKKERVKILKRESLFSEEKKPENHFFVSKSFAMIFKTFDVLFCVKKGHFWTKRERYLHFLTFLDIF